MYVEWFPNIVDGMKKKHNEKWEILFENSLGTNNYRMSTIYFVCTIYFVRSISLLFDYDLFDSIWISLYIK